MYTDMNSRSENSLRNAFVALFSQIFTIVLNLIGRRVFVKYLGAQYLGISSAFSGILSLLSFAELGIGSAIVYSLYKPIADNDFPKINSLVALYKHLYISIGIFVLTFGSILTPFLDHFVRELPMNREIKSIYLLLLFQNAVGYFFSYKVSFLYASQKDYIAQKIEIVFSSIRLILQILSLILCRNYYLYLLISIVMDIARFQYATKKVNKLFPFLLEKAPSLDCKTFIEIKRNTVALFVYKISDTLSTTIDTILISKYFGVLEMALYSNYHLILSYIKTFYVKVFGAVKPSIGNLMATNDTKRKHDFFNVLQMVYFWISTYVAVGVIICLNPLIEFWLGSDFVLPAVFPISLSFSLTLTNFQRPCSMMIDTNGLFWDGKLRPLAMSVVNIIASLILTKYVGMVGVVWGTCISKILTVVWFDPYIVYKHLFHKGLILYYLKYILQWLILLVLMFVCSTIYGILELSGFLGFIAGGLIVTIVVNSSLLIITFKTKEFKYLTRILKNAIKKR